MPPDNKEIVDHISSCISLLADQDILNSSSTAIIGVIRASVHKSWKETDQQIWSYDTSDYLKFHPVICPDSRKELQISVLARISANPNEDFPLTICDVCLEIDEIGEGGENAALSRWHFDIANQVPSPQAGPRTHMQYGGNSRRYETPYSPLKMPRWNHYPMDLLLMLEAVTANFFEEKWLTHIRENPNWCNAIHSAQELCIDPILTQMQGLMNTSSKTILGEMWNRKEV